MYNSITEALIKKVPHVDGFVEEQLPETLTAIYAQIISLIAKYKDGEIPFDLEKLNEYRTKLNTLSNTLELYLFANPNSERKKSIAFVAATARKLLFKIKGVQENEVLDLNYVPSDLYASLLYVISGNFADAQEVAETFSVGKDTDPYVKKLYDSVKFLVKGDLTKLDKLVVHEPEEGYDLHQYMQQLLWKELVYGIKRFSTSLLGKEDYSIDSFCNVKKLSVYENKSISLKDVYVAPYILSTLLLLSCEEMWRHALVNIQTPVGIEEKSWKNVLRKQAEVRPFLWENHLEAIAKGILDVGVSSVITYPTGAGKTTLSELKIISCLLRNKRVIYLVPTHALENQVKISLSKLTDRMNNLILNRDGEFSWFEEEEEEENNIMVMTPERCLALLHLDPEKLHDVGLVVFDEFHLVHGDFDNKRANDAMTLVVELLDIIPTADYFFVSAMVRNGKDVAGWIESVTARKCVLLDSPWKPTCQLQGCMVYNKQEINKLNRIITFSKRKKRYKKPTTALNKVMQVTPYCIFSLKSVWDDVNRANYRLVKLTSKSVNLLANSEWKLSSNCNSVAAEVASRYAASNYKTIIFATTPSFATTIQKKVNILLGYNNVGWIKHNEKEKYKAIALELGDETYSYLFESESATVHHGNMLPEERIISEHYFKSKDGVNVLVATPTLAQGVNLPADIVLIAGDKRYDRNNWSQIQAHEILNAAGRAGRAGFQSHGTAILIPSFIATYEDNVAKGEWLKVRDEIFSKGDRCLDIKDPLSDFFNAEIYKDKNLMQKYFNINLSDAKRKYGKTFYSYQMGLKDKTADFNTQLDALISENLPEENVEQEWLSELSEKTSVDQDLLMTFYESIELDFVIGLDSPIVLCILDHLKTIMIGKRTLMDTFFSSLNNAETVKKIVLPKGVNSWTEGGIEKFFSLVEMYVKGKSLLEIELSMECAKDKKLLHARQFALKIIPDVSYTCGAFVQVLMKKLNQQEEIPKDIKVFASCIKEGVLSYDMLKEKYKNKYMRVECHYRYAGTKI